MELETATIRGKGEKCLLVTVSSMVWTSKMLMMSDDDDVSRLLDMLPAWIGDI